MALDADLLCALGWQKGVATIASSGSWTNKEDGSRLPLRHELLTASLDAALALVERLDLSPKLAILAAIATLDEWGGFDLKRLPLAIIHFAICSHQALIEEQPRA
jgi:hypothetical protein